MRNLILFLAVLTGLYSCSCNYHIKRIKNKCGVEKDTITINDTIVIDSSRYDTTISIREMWHDTVIFVKGKDTYHFFYDTIKKELKFSHKQAPILVPFVKKQVFIKYEEKAKMPFWVYICLGLAGLSIIFLMFKR